MPVVRLEGVTEEITVGTIYCVGRNYKAHVLEMGGDLPTVPVVFMKPSGAVVTEGEPLRLPAFSRDVHHEVELVVLIGMEGKDIPRAEAMDYVIGYGVGLDLTARDLQNEAKSKGLPWTICKGFDGSAPLSRFVRAAGVGDPQGLELTLRVNDTVRQHSGTGLMIFTVAELIAYLSTIFALRSGDLIYTGTPEGVGPLHPGDRLELMLGSAVTDAAAPGLAVKTPMAASPVGSAPPASGLLVRARFEVEGKAGS